MSNVERTTDNMQKLIGSLKELPINEVSKVVNAEAAVQPVADFLVESARFAGAMKSFHIFDTLVCVDDKDHMPFKPNL
jgi:hypothetical protein